MSPKLNLFTLFSVECLVLEILLEKKKIFNFIRLKIHVNSPTVCETVISIQVSGETEGAYLKPGGANHPQVLSPVCACAQAQAWTC